MAEIIEALIAKGWKQGDLADRLGTSQPNISRWRKGSEPRGDTRDKLRDLAAAEGIIPNPSRPGARRAPAAPRVVTVPIVSWISAGKMSGSDVPPNVRAGRRVPAASLPTGGEWIALEVEGDSMNLVAPAGALIFVDLSDKRLLEERFYVFATENGDATFKRYRGGRRPRLQPFSTNPDHETIHPTADVKVVGRVRRVINDLS